MKVLWLSLTLEGFGRYRDAITVEFQDGINTIVAPNEFGKSTLVAGLSAVIFGLESRSRSDAFSIARFQNWDAPPRFRGRLEFSADGQRFRITRRFDTHRVTFESLLANGSWTILGEGEHNPSAHKRNERYEGAISRFIGVRSRELFERTFLVGQPLPEAGGIDQSVQDRLSGSDGGVDRALESLLSGLREITRFNASFGVGTSNARSDRELDVVEKRIAAAEAAILEQSRTLDQLPVRQAELVEAEEKHRRNAAELREKRATDSAWSEWRAARATYENAIKQKDTYQTALDRIREISRVLEEMRHRLSSSYPGLSDEADNTGEVLREIITLEAELGDRKDRLSLLEQQLTEALSEAGCIGSRLSDLTHVADWSRLGSDAGAAVSRARVDASNLIGTWRRIAEVRQRIADLSTARADVDRSARESATLLGARGEALAASGVSGAARQKIVLMEQKYRLLEAGSRAGAHSSVPAAGRTAIALLLSVVGFVAFWIIGRALTNSPMAFAVAAVGALLGAAAGSVLSRSASPNGARQNSLNGPGLSVVEAQIRDLDARLGQLASLSPASLAEALACMERLAASRERLIEIDSEILALASRQEAEVLSLGVGSNRAGASLGSAQMPENLPLGEHQTALSSVGLLLGVDVSSVGKAVRWAESVSALWWRDAETEAKAYALERTSLERSLERKHVAIVAEISNSKREQERLVSRLSSLKEDARGALALAAGSPQKALALWQSYQEITNRAADLRQESRGILQGLGLDTEETLKTLHGDALVRTVRALDAWERLCEKHPGLPPADLGQTFDTVTRQQQLLSSQIEALETESLALDAEVSRLNREVALLQGSQAQNIPRLEEEILSDRTLAQDLRTRAEAIAMAHSVLEDAKHTFEATYTEFLSNRTTERFAEITGVNGRQVLFDKDFRVSLRIGDTPCDIAQLSQGARDQLYIALRLSIADLLAYDVKLPLVFDDPFLTFDSERTGRMRNALEAASKSHQIILLSHRDEMTDWGIPVKMA